MPTDPERNLRWKVFPRNLTARAEYMVRGNPASSRPESGVDNCYPGLEFDQRNLDKAFFPGLLFEYHGSNGANLREITPGSLAARMGLTANDQPLFLWAIVGRTTLEQPANDPPLFLLRGLNGLEVWRRVHDLLSGRIAILMGRGDGFSVEPPFDSLTVLQEAARGQNDGQVRREQGVLQWAVFAADRARYLDEGGVIDVEVFQPGDLTRSLCVPWQYDFRDCGCFYWAANKPDVVTSADGRTPYLNFMRKDRSGQAPDNVLAQWRRDAEYGYPDLIQGAWNLLPVVLNDRESEVFVPPPAPSSPELMTRQQVIEELQYLATVEHALCVEYLFAHYSLNAPLKLPETSSQEPTTRIFAAATEVFAIAVDEMRHLRWVNEALDLLGQPPSLGRAERIGRQFDRPFELQPLTPEQLQWFVDVERPSQAINEGLDGIYVRLHVSIDHQPDIFPEHDRLIHLIKLIIDEGGDHYERFLAVQRHLANLAPEVYLRPLGLPPAHTSAVQLLDLSDQNYAVVLQTLLLTLALGDRASGVLMEQARRAMFNMHEVNHRLAGLHVAPRFALPAIAIPPALTAEAAHAMVAEMETASMASLNALLAAGSSLEQELATRQREVNQELFDKMRALIGSP